MIQLFNEDCMKAMKKIPFKHFDLAIVDPPYGLGIDGQKKFISKTKQTQNRKYHKKKGWDQQRPSRQYFEELQRVSKNQIIWGANYFASLLPDARDWLVWDKKQGDLNYSMHELAWTSFSKVPKVSLYLCPSLL